MDLKEIRRRLWTGIAWVRIGFSGGSCEHSNESTGSIKDRELIE
jgi:hypothetical protein